MSYLSWILLFCVLYSVQPSVIRTKRGYGRPYIPPQPSYQPPPSYQPAPMPMPMPQPAQPSYGYSRPAPPPPPPPPSYGYPGSGGGGIDSQKYNLYVTPLNNQCEPCMN
ncbi:hypothetical protein ANCCEY_02545 [Ancylostoma ceylanicum]|uniref:Uncharacterized protein n=1 Tax=Ancylostoma ceylanicum TaxID=53326 RepID=A0A0D6M7J9_9BILA|nr:hypothetical protein ANCCEY_02545 [Ancylostoma ceylanicum]